VSKKEHAGYRQKFIAFFNDLIRGLDAERKPARAAAANESCAPGDR
jgi:hypothetical protein